MTLFSSSRGALGLGAGLLAGWISALVFSLALAHADTGLILLAYLASLPLFVTGFGAGALSVIVAAVAGTLGLGLSVSSSMAAIYAGVTAAPVAGLCVLAMRTRTSADGRVFWYPEGLLLTNLVIYACLAFGLAVAVFANQDGGLLGLTKAMVEGTLDQVAAEMDAEIAIQFKAVAPRVAMVMPGILGLCWSFLTIGNALGAQSVLRKDAWNLRPAFTWEQVNVPTWVLLLAAAAGAAGFLGTETVAYVGTNMCMMLCLPLFMAGLAVIHLYAATVKYTKSLLVLFYTVLGFVPWLSIVVTLLGALDQGFALKKRLAGLSKQV
jgi:hypothetical protein